MNKPIEKVISTLALNPHPEGGFYKEIYRCSKKCRIQSDNLTLERNLATSIYYLLCGNSLSRFHQLRSDEIWYFHAGTALRLVCIDAQGEMKEYIMGNNFEKNEQVQVIIPAGTIFGAEVLNKNSYTLVGCVVTPGFDFTDFTLCSRKELLSKFPQHKTLIEKFAS